MPDRILVTDQHERSGLAVTRCLAAAGYEVTAVGPTLSSPGLWSRHARRRRRAPSAAESVEAFVGALEGALSRRPHALLVPVSDEALSVISRHRARLAPLVRLGLPPDQVVQTVLDRASLAPAAARAGLATPEEVRCLGVAEAVAAARVLGVPVLIKPGPTIVDAWGATVRRASRRAENEAQVRAAAGELGDCYIQRCQPGGVVSVAGIMAGGLLRAHVASRYLRTWPAVAGNASFSESFTAPSILIERVERLVGDLRWEGMFELELIESEQGWAAIDLNPRPHGSLSLALAAGVPLPALWVSWCLGRSVPACPRAGEVRYRWEDGDLRSVLWQVRNGNGPRALRALWPQPGVTHAYFQPSDPGPLLARSIQFAQQEGPQFLARARRRRAEPERSRRVAGPDT